MPVTAKLSQEFYRRLGDTATNELVDWFNKVDATYRADLRQLNELNFSRFDAKLEQRLAQMDAKWDRRFAEMDAKWDGRFAEMDAKWEKRSVQLDSKLEQRVADLQREIAGQKSDLIKWMFAFWTGTVIPLGGLIVALHLL